MKNTLKIYLFFLKKPEKTQVTFLFFFFFQFVSFSVERQISDGLREELCRVARTVERPEAAAALGACVKALRSRSLLAELLPLLLRDAKPFSIPSPLSLLQGGQGGQGESQGEGSLKRLALLLAFLDGNLKLHGALELRFHESPQRGEPQVAACAQVLQLLGKETFEESDQNDLILRALEGTSSNMMLIQN